jgi:hypothetical protein
MAPQDVPSSACLCATTSPKTTCAAHRLTRLVGEFEAVPGLSSLDLAHRSYAASSVIASATFLEAAVSELFQDAPSLGMWPSSSTPHQLR